MNIIEKFINNNIQDNEDMNELRKMHKQWVYFQYQIQAILTNMNANFEEIKLNMANINKIQLKQAILRYFYHSIFQFVNDQVIPDFKNAFEQCLINFQFGKCFKSFFEILNCLLKFEQSLSQPQENTGSKLQQFISFHFSEIQNEKNLFKAYFEKELFIYKAKNYQKILSNQNLKLELDKNHQNSLFPEAIEKIFHNIEQKIEGMEQANVYIILITKYLEIQPLMKKELIEVLQRDMNNYMSLTFQQYECLSNSQQYKSSVLLPFLYNWSQNCVNIEDETQIVNEFGNDIQQEIDNFIYKNYCNLQIKNIFEMIVTESLNNNKQFYQQLLELKHTLDKTGMIHELGKTLKQQLEQRLLIPGVITIFILNSFISILKFLQIIDADGVIFNMITYPIKQYLLQRQDTLKNIISLLTDDQQDNQSIMSQQEKLKLPLNFQIENSSIESEGKSENEEYIQNQEDGQQKIKFEEQDLMSVLVNLYGSQDQFVNEYQNMLAIKILAFKDFNIEEETKNLELLKKKINERLLQKCEIVKNDYSSHSRRMNINIHQEFDKSVILPFHQKYSFNFQNLNVIFLSKEFWNLNYDPITNFHYTMPDSIQTILKLYEEKYIFLKQNRQVQWQNHLGQANIDLTFDNGTFNFKCQLIHAILIEQLDQSKVEDQGKIGISSSQLAKRLALNEDFIKAKMQYWILLGVIKELDESQLPLQNKQFIQKHSDFQEDTKFVYCNTLIQKQKQIFLQNTVWYAAVKVYENKSQEEQNQTIFSEYELEYILKDQFWQSMGSIQFKNMVENYLISLLKMSGPQPLNKLHNMIKQIYKDHVSVNLTDNKLLEILRNLVAKQKIIQLGDLFSYVGKTQQFE